MAKYELMLIINPAISEDQRNASVSDLKALFAKNEVTISKEDVWWDKKLAYKINSSDRWFYILFELELDGKALITFTKSFNLDKTIWRHMFVKKTA